MTYASFCCCMPVFHCSIDSLSYFSYVPLSHCSIVSLVNCLVFLLSNFKMFHSFIVSLSSFLNVFLSQTFLCADPWNAKEVVVKAVHCYNCYVFTYHLIMRRKWQNLLLIPNRSIPVALVTYPMTERRLPHRLI